jgi:hypothetical protein
MSGILLSAISSGFFMVRIIKGPWRRNPQYLAASIAGSIVAILVLHSLWPDMDDDFIVGGIAGVAGAWGGMILFDTALGLV